MKRWEMEKIEQEGRNRTFRRYVDDSIRIWKGKKEDLVEEVKVMEDKEKGIKLKLEEKGKINIQKYKQKEETRMKE